MQQKKDPAGPDNRPEATTDMAHKLPDFDDARDKWQPYLVKIESYFEANSITEDAKSLACCRARNFDC